MLDLHRLVALVAFTNRLFGWLVRVVATLTWHGRVHGKPLDPLGGLEGSVAARAVPPSKHIRLRAENMARVAIHGHAIEVDMGQRCLFFVALSAHARVRGIKGLYRRVVAFVAFDRLVDDVLRVAWGKADLAPALRNVTRRRLLSCFLDLPNVPAEPCHKNAGYEATQRGHSDPQQRTPHRPPE